MTCSTQKRSAQQRARVAVRRLKATKARGGVVHMPQGGDPHDCLSASAAGCAVTDCICDRDEHTPACEAHMARREADRARIRQLRHQLKTEPQPESETP